MELSLITLKRLRTITSSNINHFELMQNWFIQNGYPEVGDALTPIIITNKEEVSIIETLIFTHSNYQNERT